MEPTLSPEELEARCAAFQEALGRIQDALSGLIVGQLDTAEGLLLALFARGHVLVEGAAGLGKTLLVKALARVLGLDLSRIQFTPDLMPGDILGSEVLVEGHAGGPRMEFREGPIFAHLVLADEVNRASPRTQAALLEAMEERQVTTFRDTRRLEAPFLVVATQNQVEMEGTYPLPESQKDRFMLMLRVLPPSREELVRILDIRPEEGLAALPRVLSRGEIPGLCGIVDQVLVPAEVKAFVADLVVGTWSGRGGAEAIRVGASPRAAQALLRASRARALMRGRYNVARGDIEALACPVLRHRIVLGFQAQARGVDPDEVITALAREVKGL